MDRVLCNKEGAVWLWMYRKWCTLPFMHTLTQFPLHQTRVKGVKQMPKQLTVWTKLRRERRNGDEERGEQKSTPNTFNLQNKQPMDGWVRLMQLRYPLLFLAQPGCQRQVQYYGSKRYAICLFLGHTANMLLIMVPVLAGSPPFWTATAIYRRWCPFSQTFNDAVMMMIVFNEISFNKILISISIRGFASVTLGRKHFQHTFVWPKLRARWWSLPPSPPNKMVPPRHRMRRCRGRKIWHTMCHDWSAGSYDDVDSLGAQKTIKL